MPLQDANPTPSFGGFGLNGDPVLVFSSLPSEADERDVIDTYRRTWSLARPRFLFLEFHDELRVYSLVTPLPSPGSDHRPLSAFKTVFAAAEVGEQLANFHRSRLESGVAFEETQMANISGRADQQLLRDLKIATKALRDADLDAPEAHALIERAILVRNLEDRGILTEEYFHDIASSYRDSEHGLTNDYVAPNLQADIQFKNGTAYRQVRPIKLDKIENFRAQI